MRAFTALLPAFALACATAPTPEPRMPQPTEQEVSFDAAGMTVHGTLTLPAGAGKAPAILLIAGSGPTDRDWNSPLLPGTNGSAKLLARAKECQARRGRRPTLIAVDFYRTGALFHVVRALNGLPDEGRGGSDVDAPQPLDGGQGGKGDPGQER